MTRLVPPAFRLAVASVAMASCVLDVSLGATDAGADSAHKFVRSDAGDAGGGGGGGETEAGPVPRDAAKSDATGSQCGGGGSLGNAGGACQTDESMFDFVAATCAQDHQVVSAFTPDEHCGAGSSSSATYGCCASVPAGASMGVFQNANGVCGTDTSLFTSALQDCTSQHGSVVAFVPNGSCGDASSSGASYTCAP